MTCLSRAASFLENREFYKSNDFIAVELVPRFFLFLLKRPLFRKLFMSKISPLGMYEYVIARTKFIDAVFLNALAAGFDQILIFGAGFDSRGIRLLNNAKTRVFELDVPITQQAKIQQFKKRGITIPPDIVYISIDFTKESLADKLTEHDFKKNKRSLFILEGLVMYLDAESVDTTFRLIDAFAGKGSEVVFDHIYASVLRRENTLYGEQNIFEMVNKAGEAWTFGIEKDGIGSFLEKYHLRLLSNNTANDLEQKYFTDDRGTRVARINETHRIVHAVK